MTADYVKFFVAFTNIISELQILSASESTSKVTDITDPAPAAISVFQDHPSINNVRAKNFKSAFFMYTLMKQKSKKISET